MKGCGSIGEIVILNLDFSDILAAVNLHPTHHQPLMKQFKIVIEKHSDGYVAYPIGIVGAIVGQGDTYDAALSDVKSAIDCYIEVFGKEMLEDTPTFEVFIAEAGVAV
jgi:predicted RNase H-like HicB family nuclease